jgi:hypothetical protein
LLILYDSTTGFAVTERNVRFIKNGKDMNSESRGEGSYIFINIGRENCLMQVNVYGYEPQTIDVDYEKMDKIVPSIDVFLIPSENTSKGEALITLKGRLSGLEKLEAIHPGRAVTTFRELDRKRRAITIFTPNRRANLTQGKYAVFNSEKVTFETVGITEELTEKRFRIKENPEEDFIVNSQICRIVYGQVWEDGTYLFRVRNDGNSLRYLIKYVVNGQVRYKKVDFAESELPLLD